MDLRGKLTIFAVQTKESEITILPINIKPK